MVHACQQLTTAVLVSRGFTDLCYNPLDSHGPGGYFPGALALKVNPATRVSTDWAKAPTNAKSTLFTKDDGQPDNSPNDYAYAPSGSPNRPSDNLLVPGAAFYRQTHPHVAAVLRVINGKIQLMDTSGWLVGQRFPQENGGMMLDSAPLTSLTADLCVAAVKPPDHVPKTGMLELLRAARPLGFARLVILERKSQQVLWASQKLSLCEDDVGYPMTKLMASLRNCPYVDVLEAHWYVWIPRGQGVAKGFREGRTNPRWWDGVPSIGIADLGVDANGIPVVHDRVHYDTEPRTNLFGRQRRSESDKGGRPEEVHSGATAERVCRQGRRGLVLGRLPEILQEAMTCALGFFRDGLWF
jgi:hypothetical protein